MECCSRLVGLAVICDRYASDDGGPSALQVHLGLGGAQNVLRRAWSLGWHIALHGQSDQGFAAKGYRQPRRR